MTIQVNHAGRAYEGKNQEILSQIAIMRGYKSNRWFTFLQAKELGILTDAKGQGVSIRKVIISKNEEDKTVKKGLRSYVVFNEDLIVLHDTVKKEA
jgi:antirestriction protein ArdC